MKFRWSNAIHFFFITRFLLRSVLVIGCLLPIRSEAQFLFREKMQDCYAHSFQLESDTLMTTYEDTTLIRQLRSGFNPMMQGVVTGKILLQVLVGTDGRACLMSYENNTNLPNDFLQLPITVQQKVTLKGQSQVLCLVLRLTVDKQESTLKRLLYKPSSGWYEK